MDEYRPCNGFHAVLPWQKNFHAKYVKCFKTNGLCFYPDCKCLKTNQLPEGSSASAATAGDSSPANLVVDEADPWRLSPWVLPQLQWEKPARGGLFLFSIHTFSMAVLSGFTASFGRVFWRGSDFVSRAVTFVRGEGGLTRFPQKGGKVRTRTADSGQRIADRHRVQVTGNRDRGRG